MQEKQIEPSPLFPYHISTFFSFTSNFPFSQVKTFAGLFHVWAKPCPFFSMSCLISVVTSWYFSEFAFIICLLVPLHPPLCILCVRRQASGKLLPCVCLWFNFFILALCVHVHAIVVPHRPALQPRNTRALHSKRWSCLAKPFSKTYPFWSKPKLEVNPVFESNGKSWSNKIKMAFLF